MARQLNTQVIPEDAVIELALPASSRPFRHYVKMIMMSADDQVLSQVSLQSRLGDEGLRSFIKHLSCYDHGLSPAERLLALVNIQLVAMRVRGLTKLTKLCEQELEAPDLREISLETSLPEWPYLACFRGGVTTDQVVRTLSNEEEPTYEYHVARVMERMSQVGKKYILEGGKKGVTLLTWFQEKLTRVPQSYGDDFDGIDVSSQIQLNMEQYLCAIEVLEQALKLYQCADREHLDAVYGLIQITAEWAAYAEAMCKVPQSVSRCASPTDLLSPRKKVRQAVFRRKDTYDFEVDSQAIYQALNGSETFQARLMLFRDLYDIHRLFQFRHSFVEGELVEASQLKWFHRVVGTVRKLLDHYATRKHLADPYYAIMTRFLLGLRRDLLMIKVAPDDHILNHLSDAAWLKGIREQVALQIETYLAERCSVAAVAKDPLVVQHYNLLKEIDGVLGDHAAFDVARFHTVYSDVATSPELLAELPRTIKTLFDDDAFADMIMTKIAKIKMGEYGRLKAPLQTAIAVRDDLELSMELLGGLSPVVFKVKQRGMPMVLRLHQFSPEPNNEAALAVCRERFPHLFDKIYHRNGAVGDHFEACEFSSYVAGGSLEQYMTHVHRERGNGAFSLPQKNILMHFLKTVTNLLTYAHEKRCYFSDCKESNFLFAMDPISLEAKTMRIPELLIKISDTKSFNQLPDDCDTTINILYTPGYVAPEVQAAVDAAEPIDPRSGDFYALGATVFRCLTGFSELQDKCLYRPRDRFEKILLRLCYGAAYDQGGVLGEDGLLCGDPDKRLTFVRDHLPGCLEQLKKSVDAVLVERPLSEGMDATVFGNKYRCDDWSCRKQLTL